MKEDGYFNLTILKTKPSDSATYYCVISTSYNIGMGSGTRLLVRDSAKDRNTTLHQSLIDAVDPGDSVNLQCSIFTESCAGDHSVYWFKQSSGDSEGVLYTKGERNGRCKNSTESQTQSCVYSFHKNNISRSDSGIYYCAVASCGEILLGRGTQLNIRESGHLYPGLLALFGVLSIIFLALAVFLGFKLFRGQRKSKTETKTA
ncbi:novel immune-type receptor 1m isoform X2 [Danio rerio]